MYNFLVTASEGSWEKLSYEYPRGRFLEYTDKDVAERFQELKADQLEALRRLPCLFAYEGESEPMAVGWLTKVRKRHGAVYIEFQLDPTIERIPFNRIAPFQLALDIRGWELNRTHWAIKDEDLFDVLSKHGLIPKGLKDPKVEKDALPSIPEPCREVGSVGEFIQFILGFDDSASEVFYRGHSRSTYRLEPSLFRKDDRGNFKHLDAEDLMYRELLVSNSSDFQGDVYTLDRLVRMQHHALPTRLLDITSNPLIALYFACVDDLSEPGEVITFSVRKGLVKYFDSDTASCIANLARLPKSSKAEIDYSKKALEDFNEQPSIKRLLHFIKEEKSFFEGRIRSEHLRSVICVKAKYTNSRISFQSGAFLLFGQDASLNEDGSADIAVRRVTISKKSDVLEQLDRLNINQSTVFPYIENSAKYIREKFAFRETVTPSEIPRAN